jgi:hypothetical protein
MIKKILFLLFLIFVCLGLYGHYNAKQARKAWEAKKAAYSYNESFNHWPEAKGSLIVVRPAIKPKPPTNSKQQETFLQKFKFDEIKLPKISLPKIKVPEIEWPKINTKLFLTQLQTFGLNCVEILKICSEQIVLVLTKQFNDFVLENKNYITEQKKFKPLPSFSQPQIQQTFNKQARQEFGPELPVPPDLRYVEYVVVDYSK